MSEQVVVLLDTVGTVLIAYAALSVHHRVLNEHTIDSVVVRAMRREQKFGFAGVVLVVLSAMLRLMQ